MSRPKSLARNLRLCLAHPYDGDLLGQNQYFDIHLLHSSI